MFLQRVSEDKPSRISKSSCRNTVIKIDEGKTEIDHLSILVHFKTYQKVNGPASNDTYKAIRSFIKYLIKEFKSDFDSSDFRNININHIKAYEDFLSQRLCLEEITKPSVYRYLLAIVHLCRFLRDHWSINISYSVPTCFRANAPRSNEYLEKDKIKLLIDSILNYSILPERNVAIVLLLLDSGCRAIEITNIKIEDFDRFSSTLRIFSKKSGERKIQVHRVVSEAIQEYILITKRNSETSSGNLFLKVDGSPLTCRAIDGTIYNIIKRAKLSFAVSPKQFRHTYITNAIDNGYDLSKVALTVGHKHLLSTLYYYYRNRKKLVESTLPYSPVQSIFGR